MSIARVNTDYLTGAADAIRRKTGSQNPIPLTQFENEIDDIPTATLTTKTITQNGVYNASSDNVDGYDVVTVSVPEKNPLDEYFANTLEVANIPSATSISDNFFNNKNNLKFANIPNLTTLPLNLFAFCLKLEAITLSISLTTIGDYAFYGCKKLVLTSFPKSVTSVGRAAFGYCENVPYLDMSEFENIPTLAVNGFVSTTFPFYFRDQQQLDAWAAATNWSTYADRFQIKPSGVI